MDEAKPATEKKAAKPAGLPGDPIEFQVMNEIGMISQLAENIFQLHLPRGMTVAQFTVLNHLLRLEVQQTIGELASAMQVSQPTMSSTVRKLEDKGLIALIHDPEDRRVRRVGVTDSGRQARTQAVRNIAPWSEKLKNIIPAATWTRLLPDLNLIRKSLDEMRG